MNELQQKNTPIFESIFGKDWNSLPPIMKKHYANHAYSSEVTIVEGTLDVFCKPSLLWLSPLMRILGQIPMFNERNVPVCVRFESDLKSKSFHFNRKFCFADRKPYTFHSRMLQIDGDEVIEIMKFGLGWKMRYSWDGEKVLLTHRGYAIRIFGYFFPLPLTMLVGRGSAAEYPVDDNTFDMEVSMTHPWWGKIIGYKGRFEVAN